METLKKIVRNQYFPAAAVLLAVVLFWLIAMFGGLSLLNNNQPPMATLTWMLFVYAAAVLTPLAGILAGVDLVRRWRRNRYDASMGRDEAAGNAPGEQDAVNHERLQDAEVQVPLVQEQPEREQPAEERPAEQRPARQQTAEEQAAKKRPGQAKQRKKAA